MLITKILLVLCIIYCLYSYFRNYPFFFSFFFPLLCFPLLCRSTPLSPFPSSFDFRVGGFAWIFSEIKRGRIFPENEMRGPKKSNFFLFFLGVLYRFSRKSNGKRMGAGKKAIFFVFLRVLHGFSRKSNGK